jgi:exopolysaccharide biosynthesis polyprenyl glycosylphosphotransferase
MSHINGLEVILANRPPNEFSEHVGSNSEVGADDVSRGFARCRAHWRGPRRVNLAAVGPEFISSSAESCINDVPLKRVLDLAASALILCLALPVLLCTAIAVRFESAGPILYRQTRVGRHGERFNIYKFRTMRVDAEDVAGPQWALLHDPRVTRIGGFLRRMRIDELPQLINVFKGEMSIVGPRPERPFFVQSLVKEIPSYAQRHHARPGITGWAQINCPYGASTEDAKEKLSYDLYYLKNSSCIFDLLILLSTPKAVLIGRGGR